MTTPEITKAPAGALQEGETKRVDADEAVDANDAKQAPNAAHRPTLLTPCPRASVGPEGDSERSRFGPREEQ